MPTLSTYAALSNESHEEVLASVVCAANRRGRPLTSASVRHPSTNLISPVRRGVRSRSAPSAHGVDEPSQNVQPDHHARDLPGERAPTWNVDDGKDGQG